MFSWREDVHVAPDGSRLRFSVFGTERGEPPLALLDGVGCEGFIWRRMHGAWTRSRRLLHLRYRGHGGSDVPEGYRNLTIEEAADDLARVMDALSIERIVPTGHSMGCQVALEFHRRHPGRTAGLILCCGSYGKPLDTFHDNEVLKTVWPLARRVVERFPGATRRLVETILPTELAFFVSSHVELNPEWVRREDFMPYFDHLARIDPVVFMRFLDNANRHSAWDHLPRVDVPVLVVAAEHDRFTPVRLSVDMQRRIPGAELLLIRNGSHAALIEQPDLVALRVERFLRDRVSAAARPALRRTARRAADPSPRRSRAAAR